MRPWLLPRSLLGQVTLWIILPLSLLMLGSALAGVLAYRQTITSLLTDRDRQLAILSATRISETAEGYARVLETLAANSNIRSPQASTRAAAVADASDVLQIFNAGIVIADAAGRVITIAPDSVNPLGDDLANQAFFATLLAQKQPAFSDVLTDAGTGQDMIVIAVPIFDDQDALTGALAGAIHLHNTPLSEPVRRLKLGDEGFAYLVDGEGRVIFHPEATFIGADFRNRPFVLRVIAGDSGGTVWTTPEGERLVQGYAPVPATGWGLVIREPWELVVAPVKVYGVVASTTSTVAVLAAVFLLWTGVRRVTRPVQWLAAQSSRIASGQALMPTTASGILEIDQLKTAFTRMAGEIAAYRAGLRRYVRALTTAREDEQRRLARELHDETIQSLLAIARRLELYQGLPPATTAAHTAQLAELQALVTNTLTGLREITRDLRPLVLEDLGLVPALRALLQAWQRAEPGRPKRVEVKVTGPEVPLNGDQELALYRIAQEGLANVRKHAAASQVQVRLSFTSEQVTLVIQDNGRGFQAPETLAELAQTGHFGLMGIQERVWALNGTFALTVAPGQGARLMVTLPLASQTSSPA
jgi:signal transduction histidine kinase